MVLGLGVVVYKEVGAGWGGREWRIGLPDWIELGLDVLSLFTTWD